MTGSDSIGRDYRPRLLESLMPFLTHLITSHRVPELLSSDTHSPSSSLIFDSENLEIYVACLARLSEFTDYEGSFWCLWEDARQHSKLEQPLIDKLVVFANPRCPFQVGLRSAATEVLEIYKLDTEGNLKLVRSHSPATIVWSVANVLRSTTSFFRGPKSQEEQPDGPVELATRVEPLAHSLGVTEEV